MAQSRGKRIGREGAWGAWTVAAVLVLGVSIGWLGPPGSADHSGWSVPIRLAGDDAPYWSGSAVNPQVAVDDSGNAIAVWRQRDATGWSIVSNRYSAGSGWDTARVIDTASGTPLLPQVAVDASGNAIAVWTKDPYPYSLYQGRPSRLWANRYNAIVDCVNLCWGVAELIGDAMRADFPQIALDAQGNGFVAWIDWEDRSLWARRYVHGAGWEAPVLIDRGAIASSGSRMAVDTQGNAVVVWMNGNGSGSHVYAKRFAAGIGWGAPSLIDLVTSDLSRGPMVAMDSAGNAIAAWTKEDRNPPYELNAWANRFVPGTGWGQALWVAEGGASAVAMNSAGEAMVVSTSRPRFSDTSGVLATRFSESTWKPPELLGTDTYAMGPRVAMDSQGNAIVIWTGRHLSANVYSTRGGWGGQIVFAPPGFVSPRDAPAVAFRPQGDAALIVWSQEIGIRSSIFSIRYDLSTGWGMPERVDRGATRDSFAPRIVAHGEGNAFAVWSQGDGRRYGVWANRYLPGVGWEPASRVETNAEDATNPQVGVNAQGNAVIVWEQWSGLRSALWANRYVVGAGWTAPAPIEGAVGASDLQLVVDPLGNAIVVWRGLEGANSTVRASRYVAGVGWGEVVDLGRAEGVRSAPKIAVSGAGHAAVVWASDAGIWANRYVVGTGWDAASLVGPKGASISTAYDPQVAVDGEGTTIVVWGAGGVWGSGAHGVYANRFVTPSGWEGARMVANGGTEAPHIAMDSKGNAVLVWIRDLSAGVPCWNFCNVTASRYAVGLGWGPPAQLHNGSGYPKVGADSGYPKVAVDPEGNAVVVWSSTSGVLAQRHVVGEGWVGVTQVGGPDNLALGSPSVAMDSEGNAYVLWEAQQRDGPLLVWGSRYTQHSAQLGLPPGLDAVLQELAFVRSIALGAVIGLLVLVSLVFLQHRAMRNLRNSSLRDLGEPNSPQLNPNSVPEMTPLEARVPSILARPQAPEKRWPTQDAVTNGIHLIAKERILLHLLHFARYADTPEVPPELSQGRIAEAAGIERRHFAQYVRPLIQDGLVRERTAHVRGTLQRRRVYVPTEEGRRKAMEIRDRIRSVVVRIRDDSGERDVTIAEALLEAGGSMSILDMLRESIETGIVDMRH